jgi:site-specific recombinase XerD
MHPTMEAYIQDMIAEDRADTARGYRSCLALYQEWLDGIGINALEVSQKVVDAYQGWLAHEYISPRTGKLLTTGSQATRLSAVKTYYEWLERREHLVINPAGKTKLPKVVRDMVSADYLSQQEAMAFIETQQQRMDSYNVGSYRWARECRNLSMLCLGLATGRRKSGLLGFKLDDLNVRRGEIRCEREKGKRGRVLPVATWAIEVLKVYVKQARPIFDHGGCLWLFVGGDGEKVSRNSYSDFLSELQAATCEANPDLTDLPQKSIGPHSLRVSFAHLLYASGTCSVRIISELMLHESIATTSRYVPMELDSLRSAASAAHPRV